jgi:hypothetical protein
MLELFPQSVSLVPGDEQLFTARTGNLDPMWTGILVNYGSRGVVGPVGGNVR